MDNSKEIKNIVKDKYAKIVKESELNKKQIVVAVIKPTFQKQTTQHLMMIMKIWMDMLKRLI